MEERIATLEGMVVSLTTVVAAQQKTIESFTKCIDSIENVLKTGTKIDEDLFAYCTQLRKEVETLKEGK